MSSRKTTFRPRNLGLPQRPRRLLHTMTIPLFLDDPESEEEQGEVTGDDSKESEDPGAFASSLFSKPILTCLF